MLLTRSLLGMSRHTKVQAFSPLRKRSCSGTASMKKSASRLAGSKSHFVPARRMLPGAVLQRHDLDGKRDRILDAHMNRVGANLDAVNSGGAAEVVGLVDQGDGAAVHGGRLHGEQGKQQREAHGVRSPILYVAVFELVMPRSLLAIALDALNDALQQVTGIGAVDRLQLGGIRQGQDAARA